MDSELEDLVSQAVPPSEVHHTSTKGKSESTHSNKMSNYSSDPTSFMPEHELVELLWENGQIVMQGQSNRTKKSSVSTDFGFNGRFEEKFGHNGEMDSVAHNLHLKVPSAMNDQVDDAAPWFNYTMDDSIQNEFEFFSDISGFQMPSLSNTNNNLYHAKGNGFSQQTKDSPVLRSSPGASDTNRSKPNNLLNFPQYYHNLSENTKPRDMDLGKSNQFGDLNGNCTKFQKPLQQGYNGGFMNFPHFSRPVSLVKANLHSIDKLKIHEKSCTVESSYPMESTVIEPKTVDSCSYGKTLVDDDSNVVNIISTSSNCQASCLDLERKESEKGDEAFVATSSVCSVHDDVVAASNDLKKRSKKRAREGEESEEESDDVEEELFASKKPSSVLATSGKRSRAAEVHNLSERRRRDRINEKMKALQELIPNCNKVDKASMLDEAIEYLKSLQLQIQIMSMGNGLFMPPMMLPAGMKLQHLRLPQISHLAPFGVGMGLRFGMGMIDCNGSPGFIPVPPLIPGTQFPFTVPAAAGFNGIPGQMFPVQVPHASSLFNSQANISPHNPIKAADKDPTCSNNQKEQCLNLESVEHANRNLSANAKGK